MNQVWQDFLQQHGATIDQGVTADFSDSTFDFRQIEQSTILVDLSHRALIKVCGEEAKDFLQAQFCNDVNDVDETHSQLSAYCTPKGRILASFRLFKSDDGYFMSMPADVMEATLKRLKMFVLRSKVSLDDIGQESVQIGLAGPEAADLLTAEFGPPPTAGNEVVEQKGITCIRINAKTPRFELIGNPSALQPLWEKLAAASQPVASHYWQWLDIQDGIPSVTAPVVEAFVPQMVNLHWIDGLSFKKGCYPGQEIVARTHYLGKLKRRMFLAHLESTTCPTAGDELHRASAPEGQSAGRVLMSHPAPQGGCDLLVVMQIDAVENDEIVANQDPAQKLQFGELPYDTEGGG